MVIEEATQFLRKVPPFQFLDAETFSHVVTEMSMDFYPKGTVIFKQNDMPSKFLRVIKKGGVKVSLKTNEGEDIVLDYRSEGDAFGLWSIVENTRQKTTVVAIDDTICYLIPAEIVRKLLDSSAVFTEFFLKDHLTKYVDRTYSEMLNKSAFYGGTDRVLFTTQVGDIAIKDVISVHEKVSIQETAKVMAKQKISSLVVMDGHGSPSGIVTDRDLREKVVALGRNVQEPVENIMSLPLIRVDATDYCFEAVLKMIKHNIHHILVVKDGALKGVVTNHDFMILQGGSPLTFAKDIENQQTVDGLVPVSGKINKIIHLLLREGARASNITKIISELNDRLVRKILEIAEHTYGKPPVPYCWIAYGSEGRKEQTFKTDQDNAIIYANPSSPGHLQEIIKYFTGFTAFVRDSLIKVGFPSCEADFMASNPKWCQPLEVWEKYFSSWIHTPTPDAILKSLIFFDFRPLHGDLSLAERLRDFLNRSLKGQNIFLARMANAITINRPPLGFFKTFIVERSGDHKDKLNFKIRGIGPLVDIVRLFALEEGVSETSTIERIGAMKSSHPLIIELGDELEQAFEFIMLLRIHHQLDQMENAVPMDNFIDPAKLSNLEKKSLRESFQLILKTQDAITELFRPGMVS